MFCFLFTSGCRGLDAFPAPSPVLSSKWRHHRAASPSTFQNKPLRLCHPRRCQTTGWHPVPSAWRIEHPFRGALETSGRNCCGSTSTGSQQAAPRTLSGGCQLPGGGVVAGGGPHLCRGVFRRNGGPQASALLPSRPAEQRVLSLAQVGRLRLVTERIMMLSLDIPRETPSRPPRRQRAGKWSGGPSRCRKSSCAGGS